MTDEQELAELRRLNAVLRAKNATLQEDLAKAEQLIDLLRLGLREGLVPELEQFNAVFANIMRLLP